MTQIRVGALVYTVGVDQSSLQSTKAKLAELANPHTATITVKLDSGAQAAIASLTSSISALDGSVTSLTAKLGGLGEGTKRVSAGTNTYAAEMRALAGDVKAGTLSVTQQEAALKSLKARMDDEMSSLKSLGVLTEQQTARLTQLRASAGDVGAALAKLTQQQDTSRAAQLEQMRAAKMLALEMDEVRRAYRAGALAAEDVEGKMRPLIQRAEQQKAALRELGLEVDHNRKLFEAYAVAADRATNAVNNASGTPTPGGFQDGIARGVASALGNFGVIGQILEAGLTVALDRAEEHARVKARDVGEDIAKGAEAGLRAATPRAVDAADDMADAAIKGAKDKLQIRSPSRVFLEIGENAGDAMARGLRESQSQVAAASAALARTAEDNAKPRLSGGGAGGTASAAEAAAPAAAPLLAGFGSTTAVALGTAAAIGATALALKNAADVTVDFEDKLAEAKVALGASSEEMLKVREAAMNMGKGLGFTARETAVGFAQLGSSGVDASKALGGTLQASMNLARATTGDLGQAAKVAAGFLNAFKLEASAMPDVADSVSSAVNNTTISMDNLAEGVAAGGSTAKGFGVSYQEFLAVLSTGTDAMMSASDAGTSFKTFLLALTPNSKEAAAAMTQLGFSAFDADGKFKGIRAVVEELAPKFAHMSDQQRIATGEAIFGQDAFRILNLLMQQGSDGLERRIGIMTNEGEATRSAGERMNTAKGSTLEFNRAMEKLNVTLGEKILPLFTPIVQGATDVADALSNVATASDLKWNEGDNGWVLFFKTLASGFKVITDFLGSPAGKWLTGQGPATVMQNVAKDIGLQQLQTRLIGAGILARPASREANRAQLEALGANRAQFEARLDAYNSRDRNGVQTALGLTNPLTQIPGATTAGLPGARSVASAWSSDFITSLKDVFVKDDQVSSDCAIIASRILQAIGVEIKPNANARQLVENAKAAGFQQVGGAGVAQSGDLVAWKSGNGKQYGATSGMHVAVVVGRDAKGRLLIIENPGKANTQVVPMYDTQNASFYRAPSSPYTMQATAAKTSPNLPKPVDFAALTVEAQRLTAALDQAVKTGNQDGWRKATADLDAFRKKSEAHAQALEWVNLQNGRVTKSTSQFGQAFDKLKGQLDLSAAMRENGGSAQDYLSRLSQISAEAMRLAEVEKKANGEGSAKYIALIKLAGDARSAIERTNKELAKDDGAKTLADRLSLVQTRAGITGDQGLSKQQAASKYAEIRKEALALAAAQKDGSAAQREYLQVAAQAEGALRGLTKAQKGSRDEYVATQADIKRFGAQALDIAKLEAAYQTLTDNAWKVRAAARIQAYKDQGDAAQAVLAIVSSSYQAEQQQRQRTEQRDRESAQVRARIAEELRQGNIRGAQDQVTKLGALRERELADAQASASKQLDIERRYQKDLYDAKVQVAEAVRRDALRDAENGDPRLKAQRVAEAERTYTNTVLQADNERRAALRRAEDAADQAAKQRREAQRSADRFLAEGRTKLARDTAQGVIASYDAEVKAAEGNKEKLLDIERRMGNDVALARITVLRANAADERRTTSERYDAMIELARKNGQDTSQLEQQKADALKAINTKLASDEKAVGTARAATMRTLTQQIADEAARAFEEAESKIQAALDTVAKGGRDVTDGWARAPEPVSSTADAFDAINRILPDAASNLAAVLALIDEIGSSAGLTAEQLHDLADAARDIASSDTNQFMASIAGGTLTDQIDAVDQRIRGLEDELATATSEAVKGRIRQQLAQLRPELENLRKDLPKFTDPYAPGGALAVTLGARGDTGPSRDVPITLADLTRAGVTEETTDAPEHELWRSFPKTMADVDPYVAKITALRDANRLTADAFDLLASAVEDFKKSMFEVDEQLPDHQQGRGIKPGTIAAPEEGRLSDEQRQAVAERLFGLTSDELAREFDELVKAGLQKSDLGAVYEEVIAAVTPTDEQLPDNVQGRGVPDGKTVGPDDATKGALTDEQKQVVAENLLGMTTEELSDALDKLYADGLQGSDLYQAHLAEYAARMTLPDDASADLAAHVDEGLIRTGQAADVARTMIDNAANSFYDLDEVISKLGTTIASQDQFDALVTSLEATEGTARPTTEQLERLQAVWRAWQQGLTATASEDGVLGPLVRQAYELQQQFESGKIGAHALEEGLSGVQDSLVALGPATGQAGQQVIAALGQMIKFAQDAQDEIARGELADLEDRRSRGLVSERGYIDEREQLQLESLERAYQREMKGVDETSVQGRAIWRKYENERARIAAEGFAARKALMARELDEVQQWANFAANTFDKVFGGQANWGSALANLVSGGIDAFKAFSSGDVIGGLTSVLNTVEQLGQSIDEMDAGFRAWKKATLELADALKSAASAATGLFKNPWKDSLLDDASKREQLAKAGWLQKAWWWLTGTTPQAMDDVKADVLRRKAEMFSAIANGTSNTLESSLYEAVTSGDWSKVGDAWEKTLNEQIVQTVIREVLTASEAMAEIGTLIEQLVEAIQAGDKDKVLQLRVQIRAKVDEVQQDVEEALDGLDLTDPDKVEARAREAAERQAKLDEQVRNNDLAALELLHRAKLISEGDYQRRKLALVLKGLEAEERAALAAEGLTAEERAAIQEKYRLARQGAELDFEDWRKAEAARTEEDITRKRQEEEAKRQSFRESFYGSFEGSLRAFLDSGSSANLLSGFYAGVKERFAQALVEGAATKRILAQLDPYLDDLDAKLAAGLDPTAALNRIVSLLPSLQAQFTVQFAPMAELIKALNLNTGATNQNTDATRDVAFQDTTVVTVAAPTPPSTARGRFFNGG